MKKLTIIPLTLLFFLNVAAVFESFNYLNAD